MKKVATALLILLLLYSSSSANYSLNYSLSTKSDSDETDDMVYFGLFGFSWTIYAAYELNKTDQLSKKPLLSEKDILKLKRERWRSPLIGVCHGILGAMALSAAVDKSNEKNDALWFAISLSSFLGSTLWFINSSKAGQVLSEHNVR